MKDPKAFVWISSLAFVLFGCASDKSKNADFFAPKMTAEDVAKQKKRPQQPPFSRTEAEAEICEAVIRRFARDAAAELKSPVGVVYIGFSDRRSDPDAAFLRRFASDKLRVLPASAAPKSANSGLVDQESGKRAAILTIQKVDWVDYDNAEVSSSWSANGSKELAFLYQTVRKKKKWSVI
jgi:hypothetical protein